jgi:N-dimethylarginine dimethylaminohydrolase
VILHTTRLALHLDCLIGFADSHRALLWRRAAPAGLPQVLRRHGFRIACVDEYDSTRPQIAVNILAVAPGIVLIAAGCYGTRRELESMGVQCFECPIDELAKGNGGLHCMAGILDRSI